MVYYFFYKTDICDFLVGLKNGAICFVSCFLDSFEESFKCLKSSFPETVLVQITVPENFDINYFSIQSLLLCGTPFQIKVWQALVQVPKGTVISYQDLSILAGFSRSFTRAVASAVARNKIAFLIPCHRVISKSGSIGGFRWGLEIKKRLLHSESSL